MEHTHRWNEAPGQTSPSQGSTWEPFKSPGGFPCARCPPWDWLSWGLTAASLFADVVFFLLPPLNHNFPLKEDVFGKNWYKRVSGFRLKIISMKVFLLMQRITIFFSVSTNKYVCLCSKKASLSVALYPEHSLEADIHGRTGAFWSPLWKPVPGLPSSNMCVFWGCSPNLEFLLPLRYAGCYFLIPADSLSPSCSAALPHATALCLCIWVTCCQTAPSWPTYPGGQRTIPTRLILGREEKPWQFVCLF